jgi:hypothetical protein
MADAGQFAPDTGFFYAAKDKSATNLYSLQGEFVLLVNFRVAYEPLLTQKVTLSPFTAWVPAAGSCLNTVSLASE